MSVLFSRGAGSSPLASSPFARLSPRSKSTAVQPVKLTQHRGARSGADLELFGEVLEKHIIRRRDRAVTREDRAHRPSGGVGMCASAQLSLLSVVVVGRR